MELTTGLMKQKQAKPHFSSRIVIIFWQTLPVILVVLKSLSGNTVEWHNKDNLVIGVEKYQQSMHSDVNCAQEGL